jgi:hypothetical protein
MRHEQMVLSIYAIQPCEMVVAVQCASAISLASSFRWLFFSDLLVHFTVVYYMSL